jgi:hypothetical protein
MEIRIYRIEYAFIVFTVRSSKIVIVPLYIALHQTFTINTVTFSNTTNTLTFSIRSSLCEDYSSSPCLKD